MELRAEAATTGGLTLAAAIKLCENIIRIFQQLPLARKLIEDRKQSLLQATPIIRGVGDEAKLAVSLSFVQLITIMLNESKVCRQHCDVSSEKWKTGDLYKKVPTRYVDTTCGSCFRNSAASAAAPALVR